MFINHIADPLTLEMMAIRQVLLRLSMARWRYPGTVPIYSDYAEVVRLLHATSFDISHLSLHRSYTPPA
ncbi:hypothetical protein LINGRAHAP2_LOCUS31876 [Linum grandiflorum]